MSWVSPLNPGTVLAERFEIIQMHGFGPNSNLYKAKDHMRDDFVSLKEICFPMSVRQQDGFVVLHPDREIARRAVRRFLDEGKSWVRLTTAGVVNARASFIELGTHWLAADWMEEPSLAEAGSLTAEEVQSLLIDIVGSMRNLTRGLSPSIALTNIFPHSRVFRDFAGATRWAQKAELLHRPVWPDSLPKQIARLGYQLLTGAIPTDQDAPSLRYIAPMKLARWLELGLHGKATDLSHWLDLFDSASEELPTLAELDEALSLARSLRSAPLECPSCHGVLYRPRQSRTDACPVCRTGAIELRKVVPNQCPVCKAAILKRTRNGSPLTCCPSCLTGHLRPIRSGLKRVITSLECDQCKFVLIQSVGGLTDVSGLTKSEDQWRRDSNRAEYVWICPSCNSQLDELPDGQRALVGPAHTRLSALYPEEWDLTALGVRPEDGNASCLHCRASFDLESDHFTLIEAREDPHNFALGHVGERIVRSDLQWLASGLEGRKAGLLCEDCETEFSDSPEGLRLVRTENSRLVQRCGQANQLQDWAKIALGLPTTAGELEHVQQVTSELQDAYFRGEIGFLDNPALAWQGPARTADRSGILRADEAQITFGGTFRKSKRLREEILDSWYEGDVLCLRYRRDPTDERFELLPVELTVHLKSGEYPIVLGAEQLARRLAAGN